MEASPHMLSMDAKVPCSNLALLAVYALWFTIPGWRHPRALPWLVRFLAYIGMQILLDVAQIFYIKQIPTHLFEDGKLLGTV